MSIRFLTNLTMTLVAATLVVFTQAFAAPVASTLVFAIAIGLTALSLGMLVLHRGLFQRALSGVAVLIGAWTIVASLVFFPTTVVWLGFASAIAIVVLGVTGLTAHELTTERVVHSFEVQRKPASVEAEQETPLEREPVAVS